MTGEPIQVMPGDGSQSWPRPVGDSDVCHSRSVSVHFPHPQPYRTASLAIEHYARPRQPTAEAKHGKSCVSWHAAWGRLGCGTIGPLYHWVIVVRSGPKLCVCVLRRGRREEEGRDEKRRG